MCTNSSLWRNTLAAQNDKFDNYRERLRQAFSSFRERINQLIQTIPGDVAGLTVHDLSHLDALWGMADILTEGDYELNPAEAFVLGGAILLHDSAMTVCAYSGGLDEIKQTAEYADAIAHFRSKLTGQPSSSPEENPLSIEGLALSETLRVKHASKAEELATQKWRSPIDGAELFLIDDTELREHYGRSIGRIAHSHHWDISEIPKELGVTLGAFSGFPSDWTIDQVKIALLLRCVDAMQIDDRRAPSFLASIRAIGPGSMEHWRFQNKLSQPHLEDGRLVFTSKSPFHVQDAAAWNLCFDVIQMIDRELRDSNDLQLQKSLPQFKAKGVIGAGTAETLARYIEVEGWKPLPLDLKVSDVSKLAKTLGGRDLYNNPLTPLRELIQNSADAIEARELVETDFAIQDGQIVIRFVESESETILEIDDNGVGMSERVLTSALLDFGYSFWKSSEARVEFPGLQVESGRFRGRYGIGFFSIFMWSGEVTVCSRRFNEGVDETRVLEFHQGIESRPILRTAVTGEKSSKWTTRIRMKLKPDFLETAVPRPEKEDLYRYRYDFGYRTPYIGQTWNQRIRLLCGALPVEVTLQTSSGEEKVSLPDWRDCAPKKFLEFYSDIIYRKDDNAEKYIGTLDNLSDGPPMGGRCSVAPYESDRTRIAVYEKGIFVAYSHTRGIQGIVESNAINAARDKYSQLSIYKDRDWIRRVRSKAFSLCHNIGEKIAAQQIFVELDEPDPNQPLFIRNREFISITELRRQTLEEGLFKVRLQETNNDRFQWEAVENLSTIIGLNIDEQRVHTLVGIYGEIDPSADINELIDKGGEPLFRFLRDIRNLLGPSADISLEHIEREGYHHDYLNLVISAEKPESEPRLH